MQIPSHSIPWASLDLGELLDGSAQFLALMDVPEVAGDLIDPLLTFRGLITFEPVPGGTRVHWAESGDLGGNPLDHAEAPVSIPLDQDL